MCLCEGGSPHHGLGVAGGPSEIYIRSAEPVVKVSLTTCQAGLLERDGRTTPEGVSSWMLGEGVI
jgi:hypothetical protein